VFLRFEIFYWAMLQVLVSEVVAEVSVGVGMLFVGGAPVIQKWREA